ncbi:hypothetical protein LJC56_06960 [Christensenellaceae bacterium OttesenSCG-928-K19]|nr:hypothetical protein [Christensenellaceae bacterium OttesenSCG-928-K19]
MYDENTQVYIFAAPISQGYVPAENLKKACDPNTEEHRFFINGALQYEEKELEEEQISIVTPERWLFGYKVYPEIAYSSDACTAVSKRAKEFLLKAGIVKNAEELDALGDSISLDEYYRIVYVVYFVDTNAKKVLKKK